MRCFLLFSLSHPRSEANLSEDELTLREKVMDYLDASTDQASHPSQGRWGMRCGVPNVRKDYHRRPDLRDDNHNKSNLGSEIYFITG